MAKKREVESIRETAKKEIKETPVEFLTSGSTILNLALSGKGRHGGWARGRIINIVGDGSSGKTLLSLEACAYAFYQGGHKASDLYPNTERFRIRYNNIENVMDFPLAKMYGSKKAKVQFIDGVEWIRTPTIEEMGADLAGTIAKLKNDTGLIYVIDSWDALTSKAGKKRFEDSAFGRTDDDDEEDDKKKKGTYGSGPEKARYASSEFFNNICGAMEGKDITIIIISQVRQKINATMFEKKEYRTGGKALDFYTHQVAWLAEVRHLARTVRGRKLAYGIVSRAKIDRNKTAKPFRMAEFEILFDYGLDDLSSMIDWYYGPKVETIKFDGEDFKRPQFIDYIESNNLIDVVQEFCETEWLEIEAELAPNRKSRFEY